MFIWEWCKVTFSIALVFSLSFSLTQEACEMVRRMERKTVPYAEEWTAGWLGPREGVVVETIPLPGTGLKLIILDAELQGNSHWIRADVLAPAGFPAAKGQIVRFRYYRFTNGEMARPDLVRIAVP